MHANPENQNRPCAKLSGISKKKLTENNSAVSLREGQHVVGY
jgi:hypothetical protein